MAADPAYAMKWFTVSGSPVCTMSFAGSSDNTARMTMQIQVSVRSNKVTALALMLSPHRGVPTASGPLSSVLGRHETSSPNGQFRSAGLFVRRRCRGGGIGRTRAKNPPDVTAADAFKRLGAELLIDAPGFVDNLHACSRVTAT